MHTSPLRQKLEEQSLQHVLHTWQITITPNWKNVSNMLQQNTEYLPQARELLANLMK